MHDLLNEKSETNCIIFSQCLFEIDIFIHIVKEDARNWHGNVNLFTLPVVNKFIFK